MNLENKPISKELVVKKITDIALKLSEEKSFYTRADLAFDLQDVGIQNDSYLVERFIYEAYEQANNGNIKKAFQTVFYNNRFTKPIIEESGVYLLLQKGEFQPALQLLETKIQAINTSVALAFNLLKKTQEYVVKYQIIERISGSKQVESVKEEAKSLYQNYQKTILDYAQIKNTILDLIDDFVLVRGEILKKYRSSITELTDVFGERIKSVEPNLFDFSSIEWIDTNKMVRDIELEFENLTKTCGEIMGQIQKEFISGISQSLRMLGRGGGRTGALIATGLTIINSQIEAKNKANELRIGLEKMKQKMDYDIININTDINRLRIIDKSLKDIYIPTANTFNLHFQKVYSNELEKLLKVLYEIPQIKEYRDKKVSLLQEYHLLEEELIDHQKQVSYYQNMIKANEKQIASYTPSYLESQRKKPRKPFFLINLFTLGTSRTKYNRDVGEWYANYVPVIEAYCAAKEDVKIDKEELKKHKNQISSKKNNLELLAKKINDQSKLINECISQKSEIHIEMAKHLVPIINILRIARKVVELRIDEKYLSTVSIEKIDVQVLPSEVETKLNKFLGDIKVEVSDDLTNSLTKLIENTKDNSLSLTEQNSISIQSQIIGEKAIQLVGSIQNLIETTLRLNRTQLEGNIANDHYQKQVSELRNEFNNKIKDLDNKGLVLQKAIQMSGNNKGLQKALMLLIDENDSQWINEREVIQILKENKNISI